MNREQRRQAVKNLQKKGLKRESAETFVERMDFTEHHFSRDVWEGEKVKLNYDRITHYKDWKILRQEYRDFVEANKDTVFTVEFDDIRKKEAEKNEGLSGLCQFVEDTTPVKWLFYAIDLIPEPNQTRPKTETELQNEAFLAHVDEVLKGIE